MPLLFSFSFLMLFLFYIYTPLCSCIIALWGKEKKNWYCRESGRKEKKMEKYCVKCGRQFDATGREVICPECRESAKEDAKRAAVLRAKRASWTGESVPVRISGRASTVIRAYGAEKGMPFAQALDALLQSTGFFEKLGVEWSTIQPYKSRRMKKSGEQDKPQDAPQDAPQASKQAAKKAVKTASKSSGKTAKK